MGPSDCIGFGLYKSPVIKNPNKEFLSLITQAPKLGTLLGFVEVDGVSLGRRG